MTADDAAYVAGAYEHPTREAPEKSTMQLHAEVAAGALDDAGLEKRDVDAYFTAGVPEDGHSFAPLVMADYLGLDLSWADSTEFGGASYVSHVGHAAAAIRGGNCDVALITLAGRPRSRSGSSTETSVQPSTIQDSFEQIYGITTLTDYAMAARRHMQEYGTTAEQLAEIRVAASHHAQYNDDAMYRDPVSVSDVVESRIVADPLHLLDCCVITDGGGALVLVSTAVADELDRECVEILGHGEAIDHHRGGRIDVTSTAARRSGPRAFDDAGATPDDVDYASIYDSFTITVLQTIEDLGFCEKGDGGSFVTGGTLQAPDGDLPFNSDGGGLCSNHPGNRGGMTKVIEAVRQVRGEADPRLQVDTDVALVHGTGGGLSTRHAGITLLLGRVGR